MSVLVWDKVGEKTYENGLSKGVLYLADGHVVPWNGLTSVVEHFDRTTTPVYYDGQKINILFTLGAFSATVKAVTYPDELSEVEGTQRVKRGIRLTDQLPVSFHFSYRIQVGNDITGDDEHYKIHIVWNAVAVPQDRSFATRGADPSLVEFEWEIAAIPEDIPGFRSTAHLIIDSRDVTPRLMKELETMLYGSIADDPALLSMPDFVTFINEWALVKIVDNGDGTWTAIEETALDSITVSDDGVVDIINVSAVEIIPNVSYLITSSDGNAPTQLYSITDNGDGTFIVDSGYDELINVTEQGVITLAHIDTIFGGPDMFRIKDTFDTEI